MDLWLRESILMMKYVAVETNVPLRFAAFINEGLFVLNNMSTGD